MDDGCKVGKGLKFSTNSFSYNECLNLVKALNDNFNLKASVQSAGSNDQYVIYIWKESMNICDGLCSYVSAANCVSNYNHIETAQARVGEQHQENSSKLRWCWQ